MLVAERGGIGRALFPFDLAFRDAIGEDAVSGATGGLRLGFGSKTGRTGIFREVAGLSPTC